MKGVTRTAWTLIIGPHTCKKHRGKNDISYFSCNDCLRDKKTITAITEHEFGEDEHGADDNFTPIHAPSMEQHVCQVSGTEASIKVARYKMKKQVQENPSKPIPQIYLESR